jgi:hypothetical protein
MYHGKALTAAAILALTVTAPSAKQMPSGRPTPLELPALPEYCQARFGEDQAYRNDWAQRLGTKQYLHIHHHCIGLNLLNRSMVTLDRNTKRYYLQQAVAQFNYVLARWPKDFPLTAEAEYGKAQAATMLQTMPASRK